MIRYIVHSVEDDVIGTDENDLSKSLESLKSQDYKEEQKISSSMGADLDKIESPIRFPLSDGVKRMIKSHSIDALDKIENAFAVKSTFFRKNIELEGTS